MMTSIITYPYSLQSSVIELFDKKYEKIYTENSNTDLQKEACYGNDICSGDCSAGYDPIRE